MPRAADARPPRPAPRLVLAWLVYLGVTVAAPAANGAWRDPDFAGHALLTAGVSGALLLVWLGLVRLARGAAAAGRRP